MVVQTHNKSVCDSQPYPCFLFIQSGNGGKVGSKHHLYTGELIFCQNRRGKGGSNNGKFESVIYGCFWLFQMHNKMTRQQRRYCRKEKLRLCWYLLCMLSTFLDLDLLMCKSKSCCCHFVCNDCCLVRILCHDTTSMLLSTRQHIQQPKDSQADWRKKERTDSHMLFVFGLTISLPLLVFFWCNLWL